MFSRQNYLEILGFVKLNFLKLQVSGLMLQKLKDK